MLQVVSKCYKLYPSVTSCIQVLQVVSKCYKLYPNVTSCIQVLQVVSITAIALTITIITYIAILTLSKTLFSGAYQDMLKTKVNVNSRETYFVFNAVGD